MATITMLNPKTGAMKQAPIGFSWTTFFFGPFPALIRGQIGMGLVIWALILPTLGISTLVFAFKYNKMYVKYLLEKGYKFKESTLSHEAVQKKLSLTIPIAQQED